MSTEISVKWNAQKETVQVDLDSSVNDLKALLFSIFNIAPDRQKLLLKGSMLKDEKTLAESGIKKGVTLMLMGVAGDIPKGPEEKVVFMEDLNAGELAQALKLPAGLTNLGNTCYLNSTIQCLTAIPELKTAMQNISAPVASDKNHTLVYGMKTLFHDLESSGNAVSPILFVTALRSVFPQFAEADRNGFMQQDAEECWGALIQVLSEKIPGLNQDFSVNTSKKFVEQFMTGEMLTALGCKEAPQETPSLSTEPFRKLTVNIGSGVSTYMVSDIVNGMTEEVEKHSPTLNRSAVYTKSSRVSRLPAYLVTNFVRFQWKATERVKAKILKRVKFPLELDATSFCSTDLQHKLAPAKEKLKDLDDVKAQAKKEAKKTGKAPEYPPKSGKTRAELLRSWNVDESLVNDVGCNPSGQYDLVAVLTHIGRAADSGHYIGWVRKELSDDWWKFDDDTVTMVKSEEIAKLEGGGDWHTAYICLYRAKELE